MVDYVVTYGDLDGLRQLILLNASTDNSLRWKSECASAEDDGDEEGGSVPGEGSPGGEERVPGMEEHGDHHHVHGVPVAVPVYLHHPLPEVQVEPVTRILARY